MQAQSCGFENLNMDVIGEGQNEECN